MGEEKKESSEPFGREFLFLFLVLAIIYLSDKNLETVIYPICILFSFLLVITISGKIEINFANIFSLKKDTEEIRREQKIMKSDLRELKMMTIQKMTNNQSQVMQLMSPNLPINETLESKALQDIIAREVEKYMDDNLN